jgi:hypothetical protein
MKTLSLKAESGHDSVFSRVIDSRGQDGACCGAIAISGGACRACARRFGGERSPGSGDRRLGATGASAASVGDDRAGTKSAGRRNKRETIPSLDGRRGRAKISARRFCSVFGQAISQSGEAAHCYIHAGKKCYYGSPALHKNVCPAPLAKRRENAMRLGWGWRRDATPNDQTWLPPCEEQTGDG